MYSSASSSINGWSRSRKVSSSSLWFEHLFLYPVTSVLQIISSCNLFWGQLLPVPVHLFFFSYEEEHAFPQDYLLSIFLLYCPLSKIIFSLLMREHFSTRLFPPKVTSLLSLCISFLSCQQDGFLRFLLHHSRIIFSSSFICERDFSQEACIFTLFNIIEIQLKFPAAV
jgi:hypothetical protein